MADIKVVEMVKYFAETAPVGTVYYAIAIGGALVYAGVRKTLEKRCMEKTANVAHIIMIVLAHALVLETLLQLATKVKYLFRLY